MQSFSEARPRGPRKDITGTPGNPAHGLNQSYKMLMAIQDPEELKRQATDVVRQYADGGGMSPLNWKKFQLTLARARNLVDIQSYLTNFIMKAAGYGVVECVVKRASCNGEVSTGLVMEVAGMLTEDANMIRELTPLQRELKETVESYGYRVILRG